MLTARRIAAALLVATLTACARAPQAKTAIGRAVPPGDGVWLEEGVGPSEMEIEKQLRRAGVTVVFLPAVRLSLEGGRPTASALPAPPKPFGETAVFLVVSAGADMAVAASPQDVNAARAFAGSVADALQATLAGRAAYGARVVGLHLDFPLAPAAAPAYGEFLRALRGRIPAELLLTASLRFTPDEAERPKLGEALAGADALVAFVFGETATANPVAVDDVGKPWWAAYSPGVRGVWKDAQGQVRGSVSEKQLLELAGAPGLELTNDLTFREEAASAFLLVPRQPMQAAGMTLGSGDRLSFRQPALSEMLYRFGADMAGRRRVRGRIVVIQGASESDRLFTLEALSDVTLGHSLDPDLRVSVTGAHTSTVAVSAHNASSHASVISRTLNWVDVDFPAGGIRDVQPGGWDRFEVYDAEGRPVTPGRATRVRFFETLVGPNETIEPARVLLTRSSPADCCAYRQSVASSAGPEVKTDWVVPTPAPTPVPSKKATPPSKKKRR
jgi:hypothetical protein